MRNVVPLPAVVVVAVAHRVVRHSVALHSRHPARALAVVAIVVADVSTFVQQSKVTTVRPVHWLRSVVSVTASVVRPSWSVCVPIRFASFVT